jgi:hypothetical protein
MVEEEAISLEGACHLYKEGKGDCAEDLLLLVDELLHLIFLQ